MTLRLICTAVAALVSASALAGQPTQAPAQSKQASPATAPADPLTGALPDTDGAGLNPLTGRSLAVEKLEKELEIQKKATALLEERLRQHGIRLDAQNLAVKKDAEMASFRTQLAREKAERGVVTPAPLAPEPVAKPKKAKPQARPAAAAAAQQEPTPAEPPTPKYEVVGVSAGTSGVSVVLSTSAGTAAYRHGDMSPWGRVSIDSETGRVRIGSETTSLPENAIARRQFSDTRVSIKPGGVPTGAIAPAASSGRSPVGIPVPPRPSN